jgi:hypothetical protein
VPHTTFVDPSTVWTAHFPRQSAGPPSASNCAGRHGPVWGGPDPVIRVAHRQGPLALDLTVGSDTKLPINPFLSSYVLFVLFSPLEFPIFVACQIPSARTPQKDFSLDLNARNSSHEIQVDPHELPAKRRKHRGWPGTMYRGSLRADLRLVMQTCLGGYQPGFHTNQADRHVDLDVHCGRQLIGLTLELSVDVDNVTVSSFCASVLAVHSLSANACRTTIRTAKTRCFGCRLGARLKVVSSTPPSNQYTSQPAADQIYSNDIPGDIQR